MFKEHQHGISIVILDVVMPRLGGVGTATRIKQINPDVPVIFMTGYDREEILEHKESMANCSVLAKPLRFDDLNQKIKGMLN